MRGAVHPDVSPEFGDFDDEDVSRAATDLEAILDRVHTLLVRYVAFSNEHQPIALSLWVAHTWAIDAAETTPYVSIKSAVKQSGKTRLLEVLQLLVRNPFLAIVPSEAVVFRELEANEVTLLIDEVDAIFTRTGDHEGLRAILNAGHRRGAVVPRIEMQGKKAVTLKFRVFSPKALAGIGNLPDTLEDRSIVIELKRRREAQHVERFRRRAEIDFVPVREALEAWAGKVDLEDDPDLPGGLSDRAQDSWEPLVAIADAAGGDWPSIARAAAVLLHTESEDENLGVRLLADIREARLLPEPHFGGDSITSFLMLEHLNNIESAPWGDWRAGKGMTPHRLAKLLKPFGIRPELRRNGKAAPFRAYWWDRFTDPWERYLPAPPPPEVSDTSVTSVTPGHATDAP